MWLGFILSSNSLSCKFNLILLCSFLFIHINVVFFVQPGNHQKISILFAFVNVYQQFLIENETNIFK